MLFNKKKPSLDSLMSTTLEITGNLTFKDSFYIAGRVKGNVTGSRDSVLIIAETAVIDGDVFGSHIKLNGKVNGTVNSTSILELEANANVVGDIFYNILKMDSGAILSGKVNHVAKLEAKNEVIKQYDNFGFKPA